MKKDAPMENIHVFTSGEHIVETFKSAVKKFSIDRLVVFSEVSDGEKSKEGINIQMSQETFETSLLQL